MKWFVDYVLETTIWGKGNSVLDIACNDGTQLDYFKKEGFKTAVLILPKTYTS